IKIQHDTDVVDSRFGYFRFNTNDPDEPKFRFLMTGVVPGADNPELVLPSSKTALSVKMGNGPKLLASDGTFADSDFPDFDGGILRVSVELNGDENDNISIRDDGTGSGKVGYDPDTNIVTYGGKA